MPPAAPLRHDSTPGSKRPADKEGASGDGTAASSVTAVAIVARSVVDRDLLTKVICELGLDAEGFASVTELDACLSLEGAIVVCRREIDGGAPAAEVPERLRGRRFVVFTDLHDEESLVSILEAGAHHVFRLDESEAIMSARLTAALRRHSTERRRILAVAPFQFDLERRRVTFDEQVLDLSPKEFDLAYYLFEHRGRIVTNAELLTSVWSLPQDINSRRIDTAACRVRTKMRLGDETGWVLRRFRREGYGLYVDTRDRQRESDACKPTPAPRDDRREGFATVSSPDLPRDD